MLVSFDVVGFFGPGHEFGDVRFQVVDGGLGALAGDVLVNGGVGIEVGAVGGNFAKFEKAEGAGEFEEVSESGTDGGRV